MDGAHILMDGLLAYLAQYNSMLVLLEISGPSRIVDMHAYVLVENLNERTHMR
jgi:hypothetical protein